MSRRVRFVLRWLCILALIVGTTLAVTVPLYRGAHRGIPKIAESEIAEIASLGMPIVDDIESFEKTRGWYPHSFEEAGITSPFTSRGYFAYTSDMEIEDGYNLLFTWVRLTDTLAGTSPVGVGRPKVE